MCAQVGRKGLLFYSNPPSCYSPLSLSSIPHVFTRLVVRLFLGGVNKKKFVQSYINEGGGWLFRGSMVSRNKLCCIGVITLLSLAGVAITVSGLGYSKSISEVNQIIYVGGSGPGNYSSIQAGIDNASVGDTVYVHDGIYRGGVIIDKSLTLRGETTEGTQIEEAANAIAVYANEVTIMHLTITNSGGWWKDTGILLLSDGNYIKDVHVVNNDKINAIFLDNSRYNVITDCLIKNNDCHGIRMEWSDYNQIFRNCIEDNRGYGIYLWGCSDNDIFKNTIRDCFWTGIDLNDVSMDNRIVQNNIFNSTLENAHDSGSSNLWNDTYPVGGNYWDDAEFVDNDDDGFCDVEYEISGGASWDHLPLMRPVGVPEIVSIQGETDGNVDVEYSYQITASDPEGDSLWYFVDWGDGTISDWLGPFTANTTMQVNHTWDRRGSYEVCVHAKDSFGLISESEILPVSMPVSSVSLMYYWEMIYNFILELLSV